MSRSSFTLACFMAAGIALSAHADTTYTAIGNLTGFDTTPGNGAPIEIPVTGTLSGTVDVSDAGVIDSINLVFSFSDGFTYDVNPSTYLPATGFPGPSLGVGGGVSSAFVYLPNQNDDVLILDIAVPSSGPYTGGLICNATDCGSPQTQFEPGGDVLGPYKLTNGELVGPQATVTPEPSSLVLLGTGVLGAVGAARRRLFRA